MKILEKKLNARMWRQRDRVIRGMVEYSFEFLSAYRVPRVYLSKYMYGNKGSEKKEKILAGGIEYI